MSRDVLRTAGATLAVAYGLLLLGFPLVPSEDELKPEPPADPIELRRQVQSDLAALIRAETGWLASVYDGGPETFIDVPTDDACSDSRGVASIVLEQIESPEWDDARVTLSVRTAQSTISWFDISMGEKQSFGSMLDAVCALPRSLTAWVSYRDGLIDLQPVDPNSVTPEAAELARTAIFDAGLRPTVWIWEFQNTVTSPIEP